MCLFFLFKAKAHDADITTAYEQSGVTLVEIMITTIIIGLVAAISFPTYKVVQQREKERHLRKTLHEVRSAILGSKSKQSNSLFIEGYRDYIIKKGLFQIDNDADRKLFLANIATEGYPLSPSHLVANAPYELSFILSDTPLRQVEIQIDKKFLRVIPPHPFISWYPSARWEFRTLSDPSKTVASSAWNQLQHLGVYDIVSRGAGLSIDGSNTDDW